jgi:cytochrome c553
MLAMHALTCGPALADGDAEAGGFKSAMCGGCHGIEGFRTAYPKVFSVPMIGGQSAAYIVLALKAYRAGNRSNQTMAAIAAGLSDQDMEDLAAYYAQSAD